MSDFLKSLANILITSVSFLSLIAIFYKRISLTEGLIILSLFLFIGFISLITYYVLRIEKKIIEMEQKFKSVIELENIKGDIKALKLISLKKR